NKATDARIKSNISQLRILAEVVYSNKNSSYDTVDTCFSLTSSNGAAPTPQNIVDCGNSSTAANVITAKTDIYTASSTLASGVSTPSAYCVAATLSAGSTGTFCADSTGISKVSSQLTAGAACAAAVCVP
ncbi:MAG TPA: hypothetical protein VJI96_03480, partial [Candidatus Andersenbacteria bacterium]|nr:hypothetical protein [Candidatus Andersenbacteria bacterium]